MEAYLCMSNLQRSVAVIDSYSNNNTESQIGFLII